MARAFDALIPFGPPSSGKFGERYALAWVRVQTEPALCLERLRSRPVEQNISTEEPR